MCSYNIHFIYNLQKNNQRIDEEVGHLINQRLLRNDSTQDLQLLLYFIITNYNINTIPIGLVSKNKIGALRTLPNMVIMKYW